MDENRGCTEIARSARGRWTESNVNLASSCLIVPEREDELFVVTVQPSYEAILNLYSETSRINTLQSQWQKQIWINFAVYTAWRNLSSSVHKSGLTESKRKLLVESFGPANHYKTLYFNYTTKPVAFDCCNQSVGKNIYRLQGETSHLNIEVPVVQRTDNVI